MSASNETLDCQFVTTGNETVFGEMLSKRSIQEASVAFFLNDMIDEAELQSILEITNKKNPSFPYWKYDRIEGTLDDMSESETKAEFRFATWELPLLFDI